MNGSDVGKYRERKGEWEGRYGTRCNKDGVELTVTPELRYFQELVFGDYLTVCWTRDGRRLQVNRSFVFLKSNFQWYNSRLYNPLRTITIWNTKRIKVRKMRIHLLTERIDLSDIMKTASAFYMNKRWAPRCELLSIFLIVRSENLKKKKRKRNQKWRRKERKWKTSWNLYQRTIFIVSV